MSEHWLVRRENLKRLWLLFGAVLTASVLAEAWLAAHEPHFELERLFGFYALYGFLACAALILAARALGLLLKRPETYYQDRGDD